MIQVSTTGAEHKVVRSGVTSFYSYSSFKSLSWFQANNGNYIVVITFVTDAAGNIPVKLSLNEIDNQVTWTNDYTGVEIAVDSISTWIGSWISLLNNISSNLASYARTPNLIRATNSGTIAPVVFDFSVSNVGTANGTVLGGTIKPGETLNFSAGALNNFYAANSISYNGSGTELVIIYNS